MLIESEALIERLQKRLDFVNKVIPNNSELGRGYKKALEQAIEMVKQEVKSE